MNDGSLSTIERALQLAKGGQCRTLADIRRVLTQEGYSAIMDNTTGTTIVKQLNAALKAAKR